MAKRGRKKGGGRRKKRSASKVANLSINKIQKSRYKSGGKSRKFRVSQAAKRKIKRQLPRSGVSSTTLAKKAVRIAKADGRHTVQAEDVDMVLD